MSYTIEQTIKGRKYLYKIDAYWDKEKKQSRQKRTYPGPKNSKYKKSIKSIQSKIVNENYGNIFLFNLYEAKLSRRFCSNN